MIWACAGKTPAPTTAGNGTADRPPPIPTLRLPPGPHPTGYRVDLTMDPAQPSFHGTVDVALELPPATGFVWMNGKGLTVSAAEVIAGNDRLPAKASKGGEEFLGFAFPRPLGGAVTLHVAFGAELTDRGEGLYTQASGEDRYLFTQFENTSARRMVPCFDEPSYKVPWQLTVHVPKGTPAFSNTHVVADVDEEGGTHRVSFAQTPPLPSYLLALAVGPIEIVDAGTAGARKTPLRVLVPKGRVDQGAFAASIVGELLARLEGYFGIPYPYDKLDNAARPDGRGAMENAGLIISGAGYLIAGKELQSDDFKRLVASVAAHEMAHQWFGDLVTMAWWDDIWLNEAFASWMGDKVFAVEKGWRPEVDRARARFTAMDADSLASARQIRQPIESADDIDNAFDSITYQKGETVIGMFEHAVGEEPFRAGVHRYLEEHAHKNATTADFVAAISAAAGRDVAPAFSGFLDQPGLPVVSAEAVCAGGKAKVTLAQERFVGAGATGMKPERWQIPVCVKAGAGGKATTVCSELKEASGEVALEACPEWILANAGNIGYYLARYTPEGLRALGAHVGELDLAERLGLIHDLRVQLAGGGLAPGPALELVARLVKAGPAPVVTEAAELADMLADRGLVGPSHEAAYAAWIERTFGGRARALGVTPKPGETVDDRAERAELLVVVAERGRDRALIDAARTQTARWLDDRRAVPPDLVEPVLTVAAANGDVAFVGKLVAAIGKATGYDRTVLLDVLLVPHDPEALAKAAEALGTDGVKGREFRILRGFGATGPARPVVFQYVRGHYDLLAAKLSERAAVLIESGRPLCDEESLKEYREFFADRAKHLEGGARTFALVVERIETCIAVHKAQESAMTAALKGAK